MNEILAEKLKKAGFPQDELSKNYDPDYHLFYPDLSELIEACLDTSKVRKSGNHTFYDNEMFLLMKNRNIWTAGTKGALVDAPRGTGSTPEEAVSNLYLELNK